MNRSWIAGLVSAGLLAGCASYQPSPEERGLSFPLAACQPETLEKAATVLGGEHVSAFTPDWVCVTAPRGAGAQDESPQQMQMRLEAQSFSPQEQRLRNALESPFTGLWDKRPALGIALSGGGSKASAFGTGVLAGLADQHLLDSADFLSSVSGGSYAAYFYYTHRILPVLAQRHVPSNDELFRDCIIWPDDNSVDPQIARRIEVYGTCKAGELLYREPFDPLRDNRYQAFLRCQQDVFRPGTCSVLRTSEDHGITAVNVLGTAAATPLSLLGNSLFDSGITISPTARSYRDGIGIAFGSTLEDPALLKAAQRQGVAKFDCAKGEGYVSDCTPNIFDPDPMAMTFEQLRKGLLALRGPSHIPFWIINAAAPQSRSGLGWWAMGKEDTSNADMFEMTAVSHGSGRYGYVSAPPSLHGMTVLDAVVASAAFFDANQLVYKKAWVRGPAGVGQHLFALDWGADIANYNVGDSRRSVHKVLPIPLYWLDGAYARYLGDASRSEETRDRERSAFIRLIDGGNGENLGVYSLFKRGVRTIVIADAAQDRLGDFQDLCGLATRLQNIPDGRRYLYLPGLSDFSAHCTARRDHKQGYNIHEWPFEFPALVGCIRKDWRTEEAGACDDLGPEDTRLVVIKPAINMATIMSRELRGLRLRTCGVPGDPTPVPGIPLLNCDAATLLLASWISKKSTCQTFPQNSTVMMTANSSLTLFSSYRELARQYVNQAGSLIRLLQTEDRQGIQLFEQLARQQAQHGFKAGTLTCEEQLPAAVI